MPRAVTLSWADVAIMLANKEKFSTWDRAKCDRFIQFYGWEIEDRMRHARDEGIRDAIQKECAVHLLEFYDES